MNSWRMWGDLGHVFLLALVSLTLVGAHLVCPGDGAEVAGGSVIDPYGAAVTVAAGGQIAGGSVIDPYGSAVTVAAVVSYLEPVAVG